MEKFAEIINAMRFCAGPDCNEKCPYFNRSANAKSCRSMLLEDATAALTSETMQSECYREKIKRMRDQVVSGIARTEELLAERDKLRKENETLNSEMDDLEAANHTLRAERDAMRLELEETRPALKAARTESDILHQRCQVQQNEINALVLKLGKQEEKTDRRSVGFDGSTAYWCGRADALAEVVGHMFEGEAPCK